VVEERSQDYPHKEERVPERVK